MLFKKFNNILLGIFLNIYYIFCCTTLLLLVFSSNTICANRKTKTNTTHPKGKIKSNIHNLKKNTIKQNINKQNLHNNSQNSKSIQENKIITEKKSIWVRIKEFFISLWQKIKNFILSIFYKITGKKTIVNDSKVEKDKYDRVLVKFVTTKACVGQLQNKSYVANGTVMSANRFVISIPEKMEGLIIDKILPESITHVKKGDFIIEFNVKEAKIKLKNAKESVARLEKIWEQEQKLLENGGISQKEALDIEHKLNQTKLEVDILEYQINNSVIVAPFDGIVQRLDKLDIGQNSRHKRDLFLISDPKKLLIETYVSHNTYENVEIASEVQIKTSYPNKDHKKLNGKIIAKEEFTENNTGLFKIIIEFETEKNHNMIGEPVMLKLNGLDKLYITSVPEKAVFFDRGEMCVFIIVNNQAVRRVVTVEGNNKKKGELFISGLNEKCIVITDETNIINSGDMVVNNDTKNSIPANQFSENN